MATTLGGGSICSVGGIFSHDGHYLITAGPNAVYAFSAKTSKRVAILYESVVAIAADPKRPNAVCLASADGFLILWDFAIQRVIHRLGVSSAINALAIPEIGNFAYVATREYGGKILRVDLGTWLLDLDWQMHTGLCEMISCTGNGDLLAFSTRDRNDVTVVDTRQIKMGKGPRFEELREISLTSALSNRHNVMSLAMDESGKYVAVGHANGAICLYHNVRHMVESGTRPKSTTPSKLHWHSNGVTSLAFAKEGFCLASSGMEGVLVLWQMETMKPVFAPRIGGEISSIYCNPMDPTVWAVALAQNVVKMVDTASFRVRGAVAGVTTPPRNTPPAEATGVCELHPQTGYLAFPGGNGVIQFYDGLKNRHIANLKTIERARVSLQEYNKKGVTEPPEPRVQLLAFNSNGKVLVTVGLRPEGGVNNAVLTDIKFWDRVPGSCEEYEVNTLVDRPHRSGVSSLCFSPTDDTAVTTSSCGEFKVWAQHTKDGAASWRCHSVGSYRGEAMGGAAFSRDGTVLAVACETHITLWDPATLSRLGLLPLPTAKRNGTPIQQLEFVSDSQYLVGCSSKAPILIVWDLLSMNIQWAAPLRADHLTTDITSHKFAVVVQPSLNTVGNKQTTNGAIVIFSPEDSTPRGLYAQPRGPACCLKFAAPHSPMYAAARARENGRKCLHAPLVVILESRQFTIETGAGNLQTLIDEVDSPRGSLTAAPSPLELAFGKTKLRTAEQGVEEPEGSDSKSKSYFQDIMKVPSHRLPPLSIISQDFLENLLKRGKKRKTLSDVNVSMALNAKLSRI